MDEKEILNNVEAIHKQCMLDYMQIKNDGGDFVYLSPMVVSNVLVILKSLRESLEQLQSLPMKTQEGQAHVTLNAVKLIYDIAHPLLYTNCGRYVVDTLTFAVISMEAVINLCTVRHMRLRMKLYSSIFHACLSSNLLDEAQAILDHCERQVRDLKEREELDPPIPEKNKQVLVQCFEDVAVLRYALDMWRDTDSIDFSQKTADKYFAQLRGAVQSLGVDVSSGGGQADWGYRLLHELIRVHSLTSGNLNETFTKRSQAIAKALRQCLTLWMAESGGNAMSQQRVQNLFELLLFTIGEGATISTQEIEFLANTALANVSDSQLPGNFAEKVAVLTFAQAALQHGAQEKLSSDALGALDRLLPALNTLLYCEANYLVRSALCRVAVEVVRRILYVPLQRQLSQSPPPHADTLKSVARSLLILSKTLDVVHFGDGQLMFGVVLTTANLLLQVGEHRSAISLLRQTLCTIDDLRAARTDFALHLPEDSRDILALQRLSLATKGNESDWFHGVKRLGAHAFAGFGIFGLGSSADRADMVLSELHTEILSLYFRAELRNAALHMHRKKLAKKQSETGSNTTAIKAKTQEAPGSGEDNVKADVEKLPVFSSLKVYCCRNDYALSLLYGEGAAIERSNEAQLDFLTKAFDCIESAEKQETKLQESFCNSLVLTTHAEKRHPIVLSRSHRYIYVAPVACRKQINGKHINKHGHTLGPIVSYRVLGKEKGSGTDVSVYNTDIPGSDRSVALSSMQSFARGEAVVRIGPLRPGECYVFAGVGCTKAGEIVAQSLSPTTPVAIEALNPLPTLLLWSSLASTAQLLGRGKIALEASHRVCRRYFLSAPAQETPTQTLTSGRNLFLFEEPVLCSLSIQQSSPMLLYHFLLSFLRYENLHFESELFNSAHRNWQYRASQQIRYLLSLQRCATVMPVASAGGYHELVVRLCVLAEGLLGEVTRFDVTALAPRLQGAVVCLVLALQRLPKRNWHRLEYKIYFKFVSVLVQVASLNRNLPPAIRILQEFYPELREKEINQLALPQKDAMPYIEALCKHCDAALGPENRAVILEDLKKLVAAGSLNGPENEAAAGISEFWKVNSVQRRFRLMGKGKEFSAGVQLDAKGAPLPASADRAELETNLLVNLPQCYSDYLEVLLQLLQEASTEIDSNVAAVENLLAKLPICMDFLCSESKDNLRHYDVSAQMGGLRLFVDLEQYRQITAALSSNAAAAGGKGGKAAAAPAGKGGKGAAPEPATAPALSPRAQANDISQGPPARFASVESEEVAKQKVLLAQIFLLLTSLHDRGRGNLNHFSVSSGGSLQRVVTAERERDILSKEKPNASSELVAYPVSRNVSGEMLLQLFGCAIEALAESSAHVVAAANGILRFWNSVVMSEFVDPEAFVRQYFPSPAHHKYLEGLLRAACDICEKIAVAKLGFVVPSAVPGTGSLTASLKMAGLAPQLSAYDSRDAEDIFAALLDPIVYLIRALWLSNANPEAVVTLSSRLFVVFAHNSVGVEESRREFVGIKDVFVRLCESVWSLVTQAQNTLLSQAKSDHEAATKTVQDFVFQYEETQKKKRKKKMRIARAEKDEEELIFEAEKGRLEGMVAEALANVEKRQAELEEVEIKKELFLQTRSKSLAQLCGAREKRFDLQFYIAQKYGAGADYRIVITSDEKVAGMLEEVKSIYVVLARLLRDRKERLLLVTTLDEVTNLLLRCGQVEEAQQLLFDVVDGLFNTMDVCLHWQDVIGQPLAREFVPGLLQMIAALGKLSKFCAAHNYEQKAQYARLSSACCLQFFEESVGHPVDLQGLAAFECKLLGGFNAFPPENMVGLHTALEELIHTLLFEGLDLQALPLVVLSEHLTAFYLRNPNLWLTARLFRVRILASQHMFAEAVAMLAGMKYWLPRISANNYHDFLRQYTNTAADNAFEVAGNDLVFFDAPVFYNHLLCSHEGNAKALDYVAALHDAMDKLLDQCVVAVPPEQWPADVKEAFDQSKAREEHAAAEATAKKGAKGGKAAAEPATKAFVPPKARVFHPSQGVQIALVCALLLSEAGLYDHSTAGKYAEHSVKLGSSASAVLSKAKDQLFSKYGDKSEVASFYLTSLKLITGNIDTTFASRLSRDRIFLELYCRCAVLELQLLMRTRKYRDCLALVYRLQLLLTHPALAQCPLSGDQKRFVTWLWFTCREMELAVMAAQGRLHDLVMKAADFVAETEATVKCDAFRRCFLCLQAVGWQRLGDVDKALSSVDACLQAYDTQRLQDRQWVFVMTLKATLLREKCALSTSKKVVPNALEVLALLRSAAEVAARLAKTAGVKAPDSNLTFQRTDKAAIAHHHLPPVLHNFSDIHNNEQPLSIDANGRNSRVEGKQALRSGPVDSQDTVYAPSEYVNIHLREARCLLSAQIALLQCLDDVRNMNLHLLVLPADSTAPKTAEQEELERATSPQYLLFEQIHLAEYVLKLLRHVARTPPAVRATALLYAAKARIQQTLNTNASANTAGLRDSTPHLLSPLYVALCHLVAVSDSQHCHGLIRELSVTLLRHLLYLQAEREGVVAFFLLAAQAGKMRQRLQTNVLSVLTLPAAEAWANAPLSDELQQLVAQSFDSSLSDRSLLLSPADPTANPNAATDGKDKDKKKADPKAAAAPAIPVLTVRDAMFLLSAALREGEGLDGVWCDSYGLSAINACTHRPAYVAQDLHTLLYKPRPPAATNPYEPLLVIKTLPPPPAELSASPQASTLPVVPPGTVSSLWERVSTPPPTSVFQEARDEGGVYSHATLYLLLGDTAPAQAVVSDPKASKGKDAAPSTASSLNPLAARLPRPVCAQDLQGIEHAFRVLQDKLLLGGGNSNTTEDVARDMGTLLLRLVQQLCVEKPLPGTEVVKVAGDKVTIAFDAVLKPYALCSIGTHTIAATAATLGVLGDLCCTNRELCLEACPDLVPLLRAVVPYAQNIAV